MRPNDTSLWLDLVVKVLIKVRVLVYYQGKFAILVHTQAHFYYEQIMDEAIKNC